MRTSLEVPVAGRFDMNLIGVKEEGPKVALSVRLLLAAAKIYYGGVAASSGWGFFCFPGWD